MMTMPTAQLTLTRTFAAPRDAVYAAFTEPDAFVDWFGPVGFHVPRTSVRIDPVVGGRQRFVMVSDDDPQLKSPVDSTYTEVVPGYRLVGEENMADGLGPMRLQLNLVDVPGGCELTLVQGPMFEATVGMAANGWRSSFTKLDEHLAAREAAATTSVAA